MWGPAGNRVAVADGADPPADASEEAAVTTRAACLEQILEAYCDIADRDDIHQAAIRLLLVQAWIRCEAAKAATDPIFSSLGFA